MPQVLSDRFIIRIIFKSTKRQNKAVFLTLFVLNRLIVGYLMGKRTAACGVIRDPGLTLLVSGLQYTVSGSYDSIW